MGMNLCIPLTSLTEAGSLQLQMEYEPTSQVANNNLNVAFSEWNVSPVRHREVTGPFQPVFRDAEAKTLEPVRRDAAL